MPKGLPTGPKLKAWLKKHPPGASKVTAPKATVHYEHLVNAAKNLPGGILGRLATYGIPAAAAAAPLLYREWLGRGYRSGRKPINDLLAAQEGRK
jgi:hypothetical protein